MDINKLLEGVNCACGKHHQCSIESVFIEKMPFQSLNSSVLNMKTFWL